MKSDDHTELSDDSSFEILTSSDEDESTSLHVSTFQDNSFEMLSSFSAPDPLDEVIETSVQQQEMQSDEIALCSKNHIEPYLLQHMKVLRHSELYADKYFFCKGISTSDSGTSLVLHTSSAEDKKVRSLSISELLRDSQNESEWDRMLQAIRQSESSNEDRAAFQRNIVIKPLERSDREISMPTNETAMQAYESNDNGSHFIEASESTPSELYPRRMNITEETCPGLKYGLKLYTWFRSNTYLKKILSEAKSSFESFLKMFEMDENQFVVKRSTLKVVVIADLADYMAIMDSFRNTFKSQVIVCRSSNKSNSTQPVLPANYKSALLSAHTKMNHARQHHILDMDSVLVSTVAFLTENVPQRWQMCKVLCLEDSKLGLNLHNFTQTMPVPNEFIHAAERLTSEKYPFKDLGYAVTLKEAMDYTMGCDTGEDAQEFLTGVSHYVTLKSAADVLTGMYCKYACRTV